MAAGRCSHGPGRTCSLLPLYYAPSYPSTMLPPTPHPLLCATNPSRGTSSPTYLPASMLISMIHNIPLLQHFQLHQLVQYRNAIHHSWQYCLNMHCTNHIIQCPPICAINCTCILLSKKFDSTFKKSKDDMKSKDYSGHLLLM